ncbi:MAG: calcineurin-like phosphoesterase family protein [Balneolales bacterium]
MSYQSQRNRRGIESLMSLLLALLFFMPVRAQGQESVTGLVFHDFNENGQYDQNEPGIPNVLISNGRDIVVTGDDGSYEVPADEDVTISVIKPSGWTTQMDENNIPQFHYIHSEDGAGGSDFPGFEATGTLPESVDFALTPQEEPDSFRVLVLGDTQPRDIDEVNYIAHDTVEELIGVDAAFGTTLGDLVFDDLDLFQPIKEVVGQIGIPWRHVIGNHDIDFSADENRDARGAYSRAFGPSYSAFSWGGAHFVAVDNIRWIVDGEDRYYRTGLGEDQMNFIVNFLEHVPDDELVVFLMHIPWVDSTPWADDEERELLFELLASQPHTISLAAHMHRHYHHFLDADDDWPGEESHHMVSMGTVCGAWWAGAPDEYGIPHSMMRDGTPTGYAFLDIDGNDWKLKYKAARRPADFQMHISGPDEISVSDDTPTDIFANVFNALPDANVEMRVGKSGSWLSMNRVEQEDPLYLAMRKHEQALENINWRLPGGANASRHLWKGILPDNLDTGTYTIYVRSQDKWDTHEGRRIIRVRE